MRLTRGDGRSGERWNGCRAARVTRARAWSGPPRSCGRGCAGAASRRDAQPALRCRWLEEAGRPCRARGWKALCPSRPLRSTPAGGRRRLPTGYAGRPSRASTVAEELLVGVGDGGTRSRSATGRRRGAHGGALPGTARARRRPAWRRGSAAAAPPRSAGTAGCSRMKRTAASTASCSSRSSGGGIAEAPAPHLRRDLGPVRRRRRSPRTSGSRRCGRPAAGPRRSCTGRRPAPGRRRSRCSPAAGSPAAGPAPRRGTPWAAACAPASPPGRRWIWWNVRQQALQLPQGTSAGTSSSSVAHADLQPGRERRPAHGLRQVSSRTAVARRAGAARPPRRRPPGRRPPRRRRRAGRRPRPGRRARRAAPGRRARRRRGTPPRARARSARRRGRRRARSRVGGRGAGEAPAPRPPRDLARGRRRCRPPRTRGSRRCGRCAAGARRWCTGRASSSSGQRPRSSYPSTHVAGRHAREPGRAARAARAPASSASSGPTCTKCAVEQQAQQSPHGTSASASCRSAARMRASQAPKSPAGRSCRCVARVRSQRRRCRRGRGASSAAPRRGARHAPARRRAPA